MYTNSAIICTHASAFHVFSSLLKQKCHSVENITRTSISILDVRQFVPQYSRFVQSYSQISSEEWRMRTSFIYSVNFTWNMSINPFARSTPIKQRSVRLLANDAVINTIFTALLLEKIIYTLCTVISRSNFNIYAKFMIYEWHCLHIKWQLFVHDVLFMKKVWLGLISYKFGSLFKFGVFDGTDFVVRFHVPVQESQRILDKLKKR